MAEGSKDKIQEGDKFLVLASRQEFQNEVLPQ